ncbi:maleylacetate reductase [Pseudonocardia nematodicida]|uniref:Maleylacetate reductase n=1 Tax=Pseudonocardia nematodicida TaxID=1206997 RepID=A0ABV1KDZ9_9PSEU
MWSEFRYEAQPMRVVFGPGSSAEIGAELDHLGLRRVLLLSTPDQRSLAETLAASLGNRTVGVHAEARMHVPSETADAAAERARDTGADGCVAVGGGSTIGLGKAIALRHALPIVAVPTTYAGSEMTPIWGLTEKGVKTTGRDPAVLPRSVIYDPDLTRTLPTELAVSSGVNAVAHAVEGLYAPDSSPVVSLMAEEGSRAILRALPDLVTNDDKANARTQLLYGSWLCGAVLGMTTMSLHHKLCHVLGGTFDLPHAAVHAAVLPHVVAFNAPAAPAMTTALSRALGAGDPATALWQLVYDLGAPISLGAIGLAETDIATVAEAVTRSPYANPRPVLAEQVQELLLRAQRGERPSIGRPFEH